MGNKKPNGYWKDFENIKKEFKKTIDEFGKVPTVEELRAKGYQGLISGMTRYHVGYSAVALKLGITTVKKPKNYWENFDNVRHELEQAIVILGRFPIRRDLEELNRSDLIGGINRNGGINKIREEMGYEAQKKSPGYWNSRTIMRETKKLVEKLGYLPTEYELKENHLYIIYSLSRKYFGSMDDLRNLIEEDLNLSKNNQLENLLEDYASA